FPYTTLFRSGEPSVIVAEAAGGSTQHDKSSHVIPDRHWDRDQALQMEVVRDVVDQLDQPVLVERGEGGAGLDRGKQRSGVAVGPVHRLRPKAVDADSRRLGHEAPSIGGRQVAAREVGSDVAGDA